VFIKDIESLNVLRKTPAPEFNQPIQPNFRLATARQIFVVPFQEPTTFGRHAFVNKNQGGVN
jgi:hypothetical protein